MSMWVCRVVWCCVLCCVVLCCAVLCCVEGWLHWSPAFISEMRRTHLPDYSRYAHTHSSASLQSEWGKQRGRPSERCHMGPRRKKKDRFLKWSSSLALVLLCYLFFFYSSSATSRRVFVFPVRTFFFPPLGWASVPMMISKVKNAMSTLVGGMMPHGHHHHHNHHSGGGQTCGPDSLPPRFPYGRPDFLDLTPELLQYSTEHASRPVLTLKRDSRLHWRTGYAEWVARSGHWWKRPPLLLKKSFNIRRYYDCFCMRLQSWWDSGLWCSSSQCTAAAKWWWPTWPFAVVHFFFCLPRCSPLLHDTCVCAQALHKTSPDICVHWSLTEALHQVLISIWCKSERRKCLYLLMLTNTPLCVNVLPLWAFWYLTHTKK